MKTGVEPVRNKNVENVLPIFIEQLVKGSPIVPEYTIGLKPTGSAASS